MTRHTRLKKRIRHSPIRQAKRLNNRHEATRPQIYKKTRLRPGEVFALFNPMRALKKEGKDA